MNRPFSAFGALAAMLGLAMFAVSSTSRSTTVRPPRPAPAATTLTATRIDPAGAPCGFQCSSNRWSCQESATVSIAEPAPRAAERPPTKPSLLRPACVVAVAWTAALPRPVTPVTVQVARASAIVESERCDDTVFFKEVFSSPGQGTGGHTTRSLPAPRDNAQIQHEQPVSWSEYSELIDLAAADRRESPAGRDSAGGIATVRSSGGLLLSAVAAVNRLGVYLHLAAVQIHRCHEAGFVDPAFACE